MEQTKEESCNVCTCNKKKVNGDVIINHARKVARRETSPAGYDDQEEQRGNYHQGSHRVDMKKEET